MILRNQNSIHLNNILIISAILVRIITVKIQEEHINHHLIKNKYAF
jgi:hypothetical protein